jgi:LPXTG-site transpeptidase (sortase) family protein
VSKLLLIPLVAVLIYAGTLVWQRHAPLPAPPLDSPVARLSLPELNIDVPVIPSAYENSKWEYTTKGVSWLKSTVLPGQIGNSVFYGHNWPNIFGRLPSAKPGTKIIISYADGSARTFLINTTAVITPDHLEILNPTTDIRLTLFTCVGFLDRDRFVATAIPL